MIIGDDRAGRLDDDPAAQALHRLAPSLRRNAEKLLQEGGAKAPFDDVLRADVHHRRRNLLHHLHDGVAPSRAVAERLQSPKASRERGATEYRSGHAGVVLLGGVKQLATIPARFFRTTRPPSCAKTLRGPAPLGRPSRPPDAAAARRIAAAPGARTLARREFFPRSGGCVKPFRSI